MVEHLALARLGLWDQAVIEHVEHILAHVLELSLDLLTIFADDADMLVRTLSLLLLLDAGDDAPGSTACADYVLVGHREQVTLIDREFAADLVCMCQSWTECVVSSRLVGWSANAGTCARLTFATS